MPSQSIRCALIAIGLFGSSSSANAQSYIAYECDDGAQFQVALLEKTAYLQLDGKSLRLPKKIAYTGDRYAQEGYTFWVRGNGRVTIKRAGKVSECFSVTTPGR